MTTQCYKVVLSDKLYAIYKKAATQHSLSTKEKRIYETLISNIEPDILTNAAQLQRCKDSYQLPEEIFNDLYPALLTVNNHNLDLADLAQETLFKLIITQNNTETSPPYFNINDKNVNRNYTITRLHNENRLYLQEYLKSLFLHTKKILIHDKFFSSENNNRQLFHLLPNENIIIQYTENEDRTNGAFIRSCCSVNNNWTIEQCDTTKIHLNRFARSHDRYLIIDDKIEVTLTSGFLYIWNESKEITSVFREYQI